MPERQVTRLTGRLSDQRCWLLNAKEHEAMENSGSITDPGFSVVSGDASFSACFPPSRPQAREPLAAWNATPSLASAPVLHLSRTTFPRKPLPEREPSLTSWLPNSLCSEYSPISVYVIRAYVGSGLRKAHVTQDRQLHRWLSDTKPPQCKDRQCHANPVGSLPGSVHSCFSDVRTQEDHVDDRAMAERSIQGFITSQHDDADPGARAC